MHKVFDALYQHGKTMYRHAHKHHKKYLWGVAGFFGLFKLFSFLIISAFTYTTIAADLPSTISVAIPATTIDIQEGKSIIQFDLSNVDIGEYKNIKNINLHIGIDSKETSVNIETLRNNSTTSLGQTDIAQTLILKFWNTGKDIRSLDREKIPGIIEQLSRGDTIAYFLPQENIEIQSGTIVMEIETEIGAQQSVETEIQNTGNTLFENIIPEITGTIGTDTGIDTSSETGIAQSETGNVNCGHYISKKQCKNDTQCSRNAKDKECLGQDAIIVQDLYQMDVTNTTQTPISSDIIIESRRARENINGYLKIPKNTKISTDNGETLLDIQAPNLVLDEAFQGAKGKTGIPEYFTPVQTVEAGDPTTHISAGSGQEIEISIEIVDTYIQPGTLLHVFTSPDGMTRESLHTTCVVDNQYLCTFTTPHLSFFALGTVTRNNMEFINQDFRDQNPTNTQIIDALFGTGGNPSAYTQYRTTGCRPTTVASYSGVGGVSLVGNRVYIITGNLSFVGSLNVQAGCIAIVGFRNHTITKTAAVQIIENLGTTSGIIIDNLELNNNGYNGQAILFSGNASNLTINNVQAYSGLQYGIRIMGGSSGTPTQVLLNNSQIFNTLSAGVYIRQANNIIVNNIHTYNNGYGIMSYANSGITINNSLIYNNGISYGIYAYGTTGLTINNCAIYNNIPNGILLSSSPNTKINNSRIFNNSSTQVAVSSSSGRYYGNNRAYPNAGFSNFIAGNADIGLGRSTGSLSTTNLGYSCDYVAIPVNGSLRFYTNTGAGGCTNTGKVVWSPTPQAKYLYGNNMLSGYAVLRQIQPVAYMPGLALSSVPYHGHRFIGEYYDPSTDINVPVVFFTGETPPLGTNVYIGPYSGSFTVRTYLYEPNLSTVTRYDNISGVAAYNTVYDSGLVFMSNFDKIAEIGEIVGVVKDLSLSSNYGITGGTATRTSNGKRGSGSYLFAGGVKAGYIELPNVTGLRFTTGYTLAAWIYPHTISNYRGIFNRSDGIVDNIEVYFQSTQLVIVHNRGTGTLSFLGTAWLPATNQRTHLVVTYSGNTMSLYANGVYVTGAGGKVDPLNTSNVKRHIGEALTAGLSSTRFFDGQIDEPRIRNRALTSGEIDHLYHSNLSAKSDHREYAVNYTGVGMGDGGRSYGTHSYQISITDRDGNTGSAAGNVMKYHDCTGSIIGRDNDNYLTSGFWNSDPGFCDIVYALYGVGTTGNDLTAYTNNRGSRNGQCNYQNMNIIYLTGGTDKIPLSITANTIYVLSSGTYIQTTTGAYNENILMNTCAAIVGTTGDISIYSNSRAGHVIYSKAVYNIFDNLQWDGVDDGAGGTHTADNDALYLYMGAQNAAINAIEAKNFSNYSISMIGAHHIAVNGSEIYRNDSGGIAIEGSAGGPSDYVTITDTQLYSNTGAGIYFNSANTNITLNNIQSFNNGYGVQTINDGQYKDYIAINNSQIYNNANDGIVGYQTRYLTINNSHIYNNSGNGIYFAGTDNNSGILNNVWTYNNGIIGIYSEGGNYKYYGKLTYFNNFGGNISPRPGNFSAGTSSDYLYLGRTGGTTDQSQCMSCSRITNPTTAAYLGISDFIDTTAYPKCDMRGVNSAWTATGGLNYGYGISLTGQKLPVFRSGTSLTGSSLAYSGGQYVAEVNKIGTYTNTQCSCLSTGFTRNNNNFITGSFWSANPGYCQIIAALYGSGLGGADATAYTQNRTGRTGQCNTENMQVVSILTGGTGMIPNGLAQNTIYVVSSGNYIQTWIIDADNCTAIIGKSPGAVNLYSTSQLGAWLGMIQIGHSNPDIHYTIFDNLYIDGTGNGGGGSHAANTHGVRYGWGVSKFTDSTLNNIRAYNHLSGNIYADTLTTGFDTYLTLNNITAHDSDMGITIYNANHNIITNSIGYNNSVHGINIGSSTDSIISGYTSYNNSTDGVHISGNVITVNDCEAYNNGAQGISIGDSSEVTLSDSRSYNNAQAGITINDSANNQINNCQSYNNKIGITIESSNYNAINNCQAYNNTQGGIGFLSGANHNIVSNSQAYSNGLLGGIVFYGVNAAVSGNMLHNVRSYNNTYGVLSRAGSDNTYYSGLYLFGNMTQNYCRTTNGSTCLATGLDDAGIFSQGTGTYYMNLGRTTGNLITGNTMSRDYLTNPKSSIGSTTGFFLSFTGYSFTGLIGTGIFNVVLPVIYSYGSGILTQITPNYYAGTTLTSGGTFSGAEFIGSHVVKVTGDLLLSGTITYTSGIVVTGISSSSLVPKYGIYGNTANAYAGMSINTSTGVFLDTSSYGPKNIVTVLYKSATNYFATHFQKQIIYANPCLSGWDNDNFIDDTFRSQNPSDMNIICALYGSGGNDQTAYTKTRAGYNGSSCLNSMTVVHASNPNSVPLGGGPTDFTIYVFPSGTYDFSNILDIGSCTAFISSGTTTITPNGNDYYMHFLRDSSIIDNIDIDGGGTNTYDVLFDANGYRGNTIHAMDIHNTAGYGIGINISDYNLIDSIHSYANSNKGIDIIGSNYNLIDNSSVFSNINGIDIDASSTYNTINNSNIYNNKYAISIYGNQCAVNNTLVYNNGNDGILDYGEQTLINNCSVFNNGGQGIYSYGIKMIIARSKIYNNGGCGIYSQNLFTYYGDILSFNNTTAYCFYGGYNIGSAIPVFQWTNGTLYDDQGQFNQISNPLSWDYLMNPRDGNGNYMLPWSFTFTSLQGAPGFSNVAPFTYSYGSGILLQSQPVIRDTTPTFITGLTYDSGKYIGSDRYAYTGNLIIPAIVYTTGVTVTGQANANQISGYNLYGEDIISSITGETINQQTGIFFIAPDGIKNIVTQIYSPSYFATHFQKSAELNTEISCASWRNNNNFITGYFRTAGTPTDENIICALYGTGPGDTTAYTQFRSGRDTTQCSGIQMNVVHTGHLSNLTLAANTIYVLTGNVHTGSAAISMADCSAIISDESTGTTMYSTIMLDYTPGYEAMIYNTNKKYTIVDNLNINGMGGGPVPAHAANYFGLDYESSTSSTINNLKIYNHTEGDGITSDTCSNMFYHNIQSYNNREGMFIAGAQNSVFNNMQVYNNSGSVGVYAFFSTNNAFNNIQIYNNQAEGLYIAQSTNNAFNNIQSYNNGYGIYIDSVSDNNIFNNTRGYNNTNYGLWNDSNDIQYYGTAVFFNNANANISGSISLIQGTGNYYQSLGRQTGTIDTGATMSRDYITNPIDTNGNYLISRTGARTGIRGRQTGYTGTTDKYSYGSGILTQIQPVYYSGSTIKTGGVFNSAQYIGSSTAKVTGDVTGINTYSIGTIIITGLSSNGLINKYSIFGDITTFKLGLNINTQGTGVTLLTGLSTNRIVVQLSGTNYFSTHFQRETQTDSTPPSQVILISPLSGSVIPNTTVNLVRTAAIDTGMGMGTYLYQVSTGITFTDFITSGTTTATGVTINSLTIGTTYYRRVYAIDIAGNTGARSDIRNFRVDIPISCMTGRDNENFIDDSFRALNPSDENIICALYGSGGSDQTAYTKYRSGYIQASCLDQGMVVMYIAALPTTINSNTVYVFDSGAYISNTGTKIINNNCVTFISSGTASFYTSNTGTAILQSQSEYDIFQNLFFDGTSDGIGGTHDPMNVGLTITSNENATARTIKSKNSLYGIYINDMSYVTLSDIEAFNNIQYGINIYSRPATKQVRIDGIRSYNNTIGMQIHAQDSIASNADVYNNSDKGIYIYGTNVTINNTQSHNNGLDGIYINPVSEKITLNNIQVYNNDAFGLRASFGSNYSSGLRIHNMDSYNNTTQGCDGGSYCYYYGTIHMFNNNNGSLGWNKFNYCDTGNAGDYPDLGWTTGDFVFTTGTISRDYITNPIDTNSNYLLAWTGIWTGVRGNITGYAASTHAYSYGSGIKTQIQPVLRSGNDIITGLSFDTTKYIGSIDTITVTGDATIVGTTITGISSNGLITKFSVFGDIVSYKIGQTINTSTGFIPITGLSTNRIVTQLYDPTNYFATHFQKDSTITGCILQFTGSTPDDSATITGNNFKPEINISNCSALDTFNYTLNSIVYPYYDSGLVLMINFDKVSALGDTDGNIIDASISANHASGYANILRTGVGRRSGSYIFNGTTNYILTKSNLTLGNTFSIAAWVYASATGAYLRIMETRYNSGFYLGLDAGGNAYQLIVRNPTSPFGSVTGGTVQKDIRQYIVGTYDGNIGYLYVDGVLVDSGIFTAPGTTTYPVYIGRYYASASYFRNGKIDEARIRNRALSSGEILQMRRSNLAKYDTDKRLFTDDRQCMIDGTYTYTGYVSDIFGMNDTTGRTNTVSITGYAPYAPEGYYLGSTGVSNNIETLSGQFTGYFKLEDRKGTTGRYTTIQLPITMSGTTLVSNYIDWSNIYFMATGVDTLSGTSTSQVYVTGSLSTYQSFNTARKYMIRDYEAGYSCPAGIYGNKPYIKVNIPARQNPDTYSGIITIDFNN